MASIITTETLDPVDLVNTVGADISNIQPVNPKTPLLRIHHDDPTRSRHSSDDTRALRKLAYHILTGYKKAFPKGFVTVDVLDTSSTPSDLVITQDKAMHNKLTDRTVTANIVLSPLVHDVTAATHTSTIPNADYGLAISAIYVSRDDAHVVLREYVRRNVAGKRNQPNGYWFNDLTRDQLSLGHIDMDLLLTKQLAQLAVGGLSTATMAMTDMALRMNADLSKRIQETLDTQRTYCY